MSMYIIGTANSMVGDRATVDMHLNAAHREGSVYGLEKGDFFWLKDMTFDKHEHAVAFIKRYEGLGFKVYHNVNMDIEKVKSNEEVGRSKSGRGRGKG